MQISASSQVVRNNLVEHFTNTNCSICASLNPGIRASLQSHSDVLSISFHPSSPYPACFFSNQNPVENDGRTNFYGIYGSTPKLMVNGVLTSPAALDTTLTNLNSGMSNFEMHATQLLLNPDSAFVMVTVKKVAFDTLSQARLFSGVKEDTIMRLTPNGELIHENVFRKSLSSLDGILINLPTSINDSIVFSYSYLIDTTWNATRLQCIAVLQHPGSKEIVQATESVNVSLIPTRLDIANEDIINLVPNPSAGKLYIQSGHLFNEFEVLNLEGRKLQSGQIFSNQLNLEMLPNGIYFIQLFGNKSKQTRKLLIRK